MLSRLPVTSCFSFWLCFLFSIILKYVLWIKFGFKTKRIVYYPWMSSPTHNYIPFPFINDKGHSRFRLLISTRQSRNRYLNRVRLFKYKCVLTIGKFPFFKTSFGYRRRYRFKNVKVRFFLARNHWLANTDSLEMPLHIFVVFHNVSYTISSTRRNTIDYLLRWWTMPFSAFWNTIFSVYNIHYISSGFKERERLADFLSPWSFLPYLFCTMY